MKSFSSNITDEEFYRLFRNAARNYDPKLNDSEKQGVWESIAYGLLTDMYDNDAGPENKWRKRCIALLLVWLLTGGLAIFRIIQLQDLIKPQRPQPVDIKNQVSSSAQPKSSTSFTAAPEREATRGHNIIPGNCFNNNYPDELPLPAPKTIVVDSAVMANETVVDTLQQIDPCIPEIVQKKLGVARVQPVSKGLLFSVRYLW